ncbi:hypothetical protein ATCC90586_004238 [Pythium insidiosum]|nr:hypothetical protein ATCC90586_004238 [Pythium insidiosum]
MEGLARRPVVREADIFAALLPRGFTPKANATRTPRPLAPTPDAERDDRLADDHSSRRVPTLAVLSPKTPRALMQSVPMTAHDGSLVWRFLCDWVNAQADKSPIEFEIRSGESEVMRALQASKMAKAKAKRNRFQAEIEEFEAEVKGFAKKGDLRHAATYVVQLSKMKDALSGFRRQMESILEEEAKLQWKSSDFSKLDDIAEEMEPSDEIRAFGSALGEQVPLGTPIATKDVAISNWLSKLEASMTTILQACVRAAISDYARKEFRKWCLLWPEQVLLATVLYAWTIQGELANSKASGAEAAASWHHVVELMTEKIQSLTKELKASAAISGRATLTSVIQLLLHLRDVSRTIQSEVSVSTREEGAQTDTMTWLMQPRFYYDANVFCVKVMAFAALQYGFEYQGNASPPILVTPLTLRCYHAIALHGGTLMRGSLIAGPAGSGKATVAQGLARLCGRLLVSFSCGSQMQASAATFEDIVRNISGVVMNAVAAHHTTCAVLDLKVKIKRGVQFLVVESTAAKTTPGTDVNPLRDRIQFAFRPVELVEPDIGRLAEFFLLLGHEHDKFHVNTIVTKTIREAKSAGAGVQTWLVLDGDLDSSWAEPMLLTADRSPSARGFLLPSGKHMSIPESMRLVFETTTLASISPTFLTRLSLVHVGFDTSPTDWRRALGAWKRRHKDAFDPEPFRTELYELLDVLCDETVDACSDFVRENFVVPQPSSSRWRLLSFFNLLHSLLLQSWPKMCAMVSGKQRKTSMHCYFLQALVWGIGHTSDRTERVKFHAFLRQHIVHGPRSAESSLKRVLILFFPSGTMGTGTATSLAASLRGESLSPGSSSSAGASTIAPKETIYNFAFSADFGLKWMRWPDFFDHWIQTRAELLESRRVARSTHLQGQGRRGSVGATGIAGPSAASGPAATTLPSLSETMLAIPDACGSNQVVVRTPALANSICLMEPLLKAGYVPLLIGPRDVGKSTTGRVYLELSANPSDLQALAAATTTAAAAAGSSSGLNAEFTEQDASVRRYEWIYFGSSVKATDVLEQLQMFLERRRLRHRRSSVSPAAPTSASPSQSMAIFVDDLHCARVGETNNSALELFRALVEHRQVVHRTASALMPCTGMDLLASISTRGGRADAEVYRAVARTVPIALPPFTDADLSSICSAVLTSALAQDRQGADDQTVELSYSAAQEVSQLQSILLKSSIKLYRVLSSDTWVLQPTAPGGGASTAGPGPASHSYRHFAAHSAFSPAKAHYRFHTRLIFDVLRSVCGHTRINLAVSEKPLLARLWCHESARVYGDRLVHADDNKLFYQLLQDIATTHFVLTPDAILSSSSASSDGRHGNTSSSSLATWLQHHAHFTFIGESSGAGTIDGYREVHELQKVELSIERSMMAMYRANVLTESLELALCPYVIQHIFRLTRVLRHQDTHLLLLGALGRKMQTITRLAAFICRKASMTFHVPRVTADRSEQDVVDAWKRTLRHALLQCIRRPDDAIVLIVKDWWLECDAIYGVLDRYLSGASKLLSDVIDYDDLDESILAFLREESERDRRDQLARRQSAESSLQAERSSSLLLHSKSAVMEFFFRCVRRRFQLALILATSPSLSGGSNAGASRRASVLTRYPHLQSNTTINFFAEWPEESLHVIAEKCFAPAFMTEKERLGQLSQACVGIFSRTRLELEKWRSAATNGSDTADDAAANAHDTAKLEKGDTLLAWYDRQASALAIEPSVMVEQISLFTTYWPRLQREVEASKAKYQAGLEFIARTEQMLAVEQSQQQILQPEMEKRTAVTRRMSGNLEKEKLTAVKLNKALEMEAAMVDSQRERLQLVEREYAELVGESRSAFELKCQAMLVFQEAVSHPETPDQAIAAATASETIQESGGESQAPASVSAPAPSEKAEQGPHDAAARRLRWVLIKSFVSILHVPTSLRQLAECIGVIFGIEPIEARDELDPDEIVLDYWESVTARLQTPEFWDALVHFDMRRRMNEQVVARVLPICTAPDFESSMFSAIHELAGILCEWVQACATFARDFVLAEPKFAQLSHERAAYAASIAQLKAREAEMQAQANATTHVHAMRELSEQERKEIEDKLKDNSSTLQITTSVWNVLQSSKRRWRESLDHYTEFNVQAMGDLLLATAAVVYGGALTAQARSALRAHWADELNQRFLMHSPCHAPRLLSDAFLVDPRTLARWTMDGIPAHDPVALESAVILSHSFLLPFIIDPFGMASEWIAKQEAGTGFRRLSASTRDSDELWQDVVRSIKKKRSMLIENVDERCLYDLLSLVQAKRRTRFDALNRDLSTLANTVAAYASPSQMHRTDVPSPSHAVEGATSMRRISSVGIGLGISPITANSSAAMNFHGSHRCWLQVPSDGLGAGASSSDAGDEAGDGHASILEFSSEACRIYLVYSQSDQLPTWIAPLSSQLSVVRFELSLPFTASKTMDTVLERHHAMHVLTEMQTLQLDVLSCEEQMETIENEILDFFGVEQPSVVYADTTKALKIIGNRSSLHTLESSKLDSLSKIHTLNEQLAKYDTLVARVIDVALVWRDCHGMATVEARAIAATHEVDTAAVFPLQWIWMVLTRVLDEASPEAMADGTGVAKFTASIRQCVGAAVSDEDRLLFDFLLAFRIYHRRSRVVISIDREHAATLVRSSLSQDESSLLRRLVLLLEASAESQLKAVTSVVTSKLLTVRPDGLSVQKWRALCFLAEQYKPLREWILRTHEAIQQQILNKSPTGDPPSTTTHNSGTAIHEWKVSRQIKRHGLERSVEEITKAGAQRQVTIDTSAIDVVSDEALHANLVLAVQKGHWFVLPDVDAMSRSRVAVVRQVLASIHELTPHSDFRLWLSARRRPQRAFTHIVESEQLLAKSVRPQACEYQRVASLVRSSLFTLYASGSPRITGEHHDDTGFKVISDLVHAAETLNSVSWPNLLVQAEALWASDELGLAALEQDAVMTDSMLQRSIRRRGFVRQLRYTLEYQGVLTVQSRWSKRGPPQAVQPSVRPSTGSSLIHRTALCLDALLRFAAELEGFPLLHDSKLLAERHPCEYKRPLNNVLCHEIRHLLQAREAILCEIGCLQAVSHGVEVATHDVREQFEALLRHEAPVSWLAYLPFPPERHAHDRGRDSVSLDVFQACFIDRLKYFNTWIEQGQPRRLAMDKFQSCEYVLEAIHQHVLRNFVGTTVCASNCLQVVRVLEDRPQLSLLGAHDDAFFLSGWRAMGYLQLDVQVTSGASGTSPERKRSQPTARVAHDLSRLGFQGIPVVLEVTTKCLSPSDGAAVNSSTSSSPSRPPTSGMAGPQDRASVSRTEFICPVYRTLSVADNSDDDRRTRGPDSAPEASLAILSTLPLPQHAFSGSSLRVVVCPDATDTAASKELI